MSLAQILKSYMYGHFSCILGGHEMAVILNFKACICQITPKSKGPPNRFLVPMNLGVDPKIMSPTQIFTWL